MWNTLEKFFKLSMNMNVIDDKNANAMASGNRLNAAKINLGYSFSVFNICFKYKICLKELQKEDPGAESEMTMQTNN